MSIIKEKLIQQSEKHGWQIRTLPVEHLQDLQDEVQRIHKQNLLDEEFFQERLSWFRFKIPDLLFSSNPNTT